MYLPQLIFWEHLPITSQTHFYFDDLTMFFICLSHKNLKKTKEEITKYCMRKAFKFIMDKEKKEKRSSKDTDDFMKKYFESSNSNSNISIPFK